MKAITKYQTRDGREFTNIPDAEKHERLLDQIDVVMGVLDAAPPNRDFCNGGGYVQHDIEMVEKVKNAIIDLCDGDEKMKQSARTVPPHWSLLARFLSEDNSPLKEPWYRLMCIDDSGREWGQPFFARNPCEGKQIKLNP